MNSHELAPHFGPAASQDLENIPVGSNLVVSYLADLESDVTVM
jgi:hypothetical protein